MSPDAPDKNELIANLERITLKLLRKQFRTASDIWGMQVELLKLQWKVQSAIQNEKTRSHSNQTELAALRQIRWFAKRLGDAIAWVLLGLNERIIDSLSQNDRVPTSSGEDHGSRSAVALAASLAGDEWGFPLLHDITDCLRIGDVTFISGDKVRTLELKSRLTATRETTDRATEYQYHVQAHFVIKDPNQVPPSLISGPTDDVSEPIRRLSPRLERQLKRMQAAVARQHTEVGGITEINEMPTITTEFTPTTESHIDSVKSTLRRARRYGYATTVAENSFFYGALYQQAGIDRQNLEDGRLIADFVDSRIFNADDRRDSILLYSVPDFDKGRAPRLYLPFYLLPFPVTTISDMIRSRMVLMIIASSGRIIDALERAGFQLVTKPGHQLWPSGPLVLQSSIVDDQGLTYAVQLNGLELHVSRMIHEFHSMQYIVEVAISMRDAAARANAWRQSRATEQRGSI